MKSNHTIRFSSLQLEAKVPKHLDMSSGIGLTCLKVITRRYNHYKLTFLLLLIVGNCGVQAQSLYITETDGSLNTYILDSINKLTLKEGIATIKNNDSSMAVISIKNIRNLSFRDYISIHESAPARENAPLLIYPNPFNDILMIDLNGIQCSKGTISIITLEGRMIQEYPTHGTNLLRLDLGHLPKGLFFCRYTINNEYRTAKIIKQ
ncbi:MAG: T9SS type A sorting domain-containing protein [Bacteroidales bacterium]|nr:T9SS type A sorting domain-containing protein [Bacteroidales bacterium]